MPRMPELDASLDRINAELPKKPVHFDDEILKAIVAVLKRNLRGDDLVFRYGGEEFLVFLQRSDLSTARPICEKLRLAVESNDCTRIRAGLGITISLGLRDNSDPLRTADELVAEADKALYAAKEAGRNRAVAFAPDLE